MCPVAMVHSIHMGKGHFKAKFSTFMGIIYYEKKIVSSKTTEI